MVRTAILVLMLGLGAASTGALAQTPQERAACQDDFKKLCPGVIPGGGRVLDCLAKHKDSVSPACKKVLEAHGK